MSAVFGELIGEPFGEPIGELSTGVFTGVFVDATALRFTVAVNKQPSRSSVKVMSGQSARARLMPEPMP